MPDGYRQVAASNYLRRIMKDKDIFKLINTKVDKRLFYIALSLVIGALAHLYLNYYSGLLQLRTDTEVIKVEVIHIKEDVTDTKVDIKAIKNLFNQYNIELDE